MFSGLISKSSYMNEFIYIDKNIGAPIAIYLTIFLIIEWVGRSEQFAIANIKSIKSKPLRWSIYLSLILWIFYHGNFDKNTFIYFQF